MDVGGTMLHMMILTSNWLYQTVLLETYERLDTPQFPISHTHNLLPQQCRDWREERAGGGHFYPQQSREACSVMEGLCFFIKLSGFISTGQFLGFRGVLLGAVYINPTLLPVLRLRSLKCSRTCNTMFLKH